MHTYGNLEYTKDEIDVGGASTSSYIHPYGYRATNCLFSGCSKQERLELAGIGFVIHTCVCVRFLLKKRNLQSDGKNM